DKLSPFQKLTLEAAISHDFYKENDDGKLIPDIKNKEELIDNIRKLTNYMKYNDPNEEAKNHFASLITYFENPNPKTMQNLATLSEGNHLITEFSIQKYLISYVNDFINESIKELQLTDSPKDLGWDYDEMLRYTRCRWEFAPLIIHDDRKKIDISIQRITESGLLSNETIETLSNNDNIQILHILSSEEGMKLLEADDGNKPARLTASQLLGLLSNPAKKYIICSMVIHPELSLENISNLNHKQLGGLLYSIPYEIIKDNPNFDILNLVSLINNKHNPLPLADAYKLSNILNRDSILAHVELGLPLQMVIDNKDSVSQLYHDIKWLHNKFPENFKSYEEAYDFLSIFNEEQSEFFSESILSVNEEILDYPELEKLRHLIAKLDDNDIEDIDCTLCENMQIVEEPAMLLSIIEAKIQDTSLKSSAQNGPQEQNQYRGSDNNRNGESKSPQK
ncbi:MAG: hypothetical protein AAF195_04815, partial [Pseudomonadota bacterium]